MSVVPYDRQLEPHMVKSPFLRGINGPGFIGEPKSKPNEEEDEFDEPKRPRVERPKRTNPTPPQPPITLPPIANSVAPKPAPTAAVYRAPSAPGHATRTIAAMMGGQQLMDQVAIRETLPQDTGE